jgi:electron transport complex protein RnfB
MIDQKACLAFGPECGEACVEACPRNILRHTCPTAKVRLAELKAQDAAQDEASA